ncbi:DNA primase [Streptomyces sp. NPDC020965]|uniref:DNA primase n=1 Tax=Streptomyces sp. NPDC020965 TaxID=3365105 RepID=UPI0037B3A3DB
MNTRLTIGLAVGAGYVLGRTKKAKLAFAVGTMVAGRRMTAGPGAVGELITRQLRENPRFKELGDQLRGDLSGVGKAAAGALVMKRLDSLADRLHDRTLDVQDRIDGVTPGKSGESGDDGAGGDDARPDGDGDGEAEREEKRPAKRSTARKSTARKSTARRASTESDRTAGTARRAAKKAPGSSAGKNASNGGRSRG